MAFIDPTRKRVIRKTITVGPTPPGGMQRDDEIHKVSFAAGGSATVHHLTGDELDLLVQELTIYQLRRADRD